MGEVLGLARGRDHAGDGRVGQDPLQEELTPARAAEVRGPRRQPVPPHALEQRAIGVGPVHKHGDTAVARQRQEPALGLALGEGVIELDEVERLATQHTLEVVVRARRVVRDADVADAAGLLPLTERAEVGLPIHQVVDLHEVEALDAEALQRALHLAQTGLPSLGPHLGRDPERREQPELRGQVAHDGLRHPVHG